MHKHPVTKIIGSLHCGSGSFSMLESVLDARRQVDSIVIFFLDHYFENAPLAEKLPKKNRDHIYIVNSSAEPTTDDVDRFVALVNENSNSLKIAAVVGIGGGTTLDMAKAVSNILGNGGKAEDYQGWDLLKKPGVFKVGVPTLSGTGAEASRTCVLINKQKNLKLGMNSIYTLFDHLILDEDLSKTVERDQYFYTAMDTYIHCIESLNGSHRHLFADQYSQTSLQIIKEIMTSKDMMSDANREKLMMASYLGGSAIGNSFVGVVHPLSAGLSTVFGIHHCLANCIVMLQMSEFYPRETNEFKQMLLKQDVELPRGICSHVSDDEMELLYQSSIIHEKPLINALGIDFKKVLTREKVYSLYKNM